MVRPLLPKGSYVRQEKGVKRFHIATCRIKASLDSNTAHPWSLYITSATDMQILNTGLFLACRISMSVYGIFNFPIPLISNKK